MTPLLDVSEIMLDLHNNMCVIKIVKGKHHSFALHFYVINNSIGVCVDALVKGDTILISYISIIIKEFRDKLNNIISKICKESFLDLQDPKKQAEYYEYFKNDWVAQYKADMITLKKPLFNTTKTLQISHSMAHALGLDQDTPHCFGFLVHTFIEKARFEGRLEKCIVHLTEAEKQSFNTELKSIPLCYVKDIFIAATSCWVGIIIPQSFGRLFT